VREAAFRTWSSSIRTHRTVTDSSSHTRPEWLEITIASHPSTHEALSDFLMETLGCEGVVLEESPVSGLTAYVPGETDPEILQRTIEAFLARMRDIFPEAPPARISLTRIEDPDWRVAWRQHFRPEQVSPGLLVVPAWESPPPNPCGRVLRMDPGPAFGTGRHATTRMCLQAMEDLAPGGSWDLLDVGTGSGILAMYGVMLGASPVIAMDIDEEALRWAEWNIDLNGLRDTIRLSSDPLPSMDTPFSMVTANLILDVICDLLPCFPRLVRPEGHLVLSGLLAHQTRDLTTRLEQAGFTIQKTLHQEEWACMICRPHTGIHRKGPVS